MCMWNVIKVTMLISQGIFQLQFLQFTFNALMNLINAGVLGRIFQIILRSFIDFL